jgi:hypothetical protein
MTDGKQARLVAAAAVLKGGRPRSCVKPKGHEKLGK